MLYCSFSFNILESIMLLWYLARFTCAPSALFCTSTLKVFPSKSSAFTSSVMLCPPTLGLLMLYWPLELFTCISSLPSIVFIRYSVASLFSSKTLLISSSSNRFKLSMILSTSLFFFPIHCPPFKLLVFGATMIPALSSATSSSPLLSCFL